MPAIESSSSVLSALQSSSAERLLQEHPELDEERLFQKVIKIFSENAALKTKQRKVFELVDKVSSVLFGYTACQIGCKACCYLPTLIFEHEALILAAASGRPPSKVPLRDRDLSLEAGRDFMGVPCPFLAEEACSVYAHRPLICRLHHSLAADATPCQTLPITGVRPPMLNPDYAELPYQVMMMRFAPNEPWGVIQEFFPE